MRLALCEMMRLFIAIDIPENLREELSRVSAKLKKCDLDVKLVKAENIHLTLKFLGETAEEQIDEIKNIITGIGGQFSKLELATAGFGFFPNENSPRVFFLSTTQEEILRQLAFALEEKLEKIGFPKEDRFSSHLTLARLRSKKSVDCLKEEIKKIAIEEKFVVNEIILYKSILKPAGPVYEKIFSAPLK
jgi:2'-5' RNA ligase